MLKFLSPSDPLLNQIATEIPLDQISSDETKNDIHEMLQVAYGEQSDHSKPVLVGLAAPQLGISKRIILVDTNAEGHGEVGNLRIYINPQVIWQSAEKNDWYEGCFSTDRVCGIVSRPTHIKIKAFSFPLFKWEHKVEDITQVEEEYSGYTARIFQHEIDHLNGKEFVTHISDDNNLHWVKAAEFPLYRDKESWRTWPNKCSREKWNQIKFNKST